jgi:hypothetical protein
MMKNGIKNGFKYWKKDIQQAINQTEVLSHAIFKKRLAKKRHLQTM